MESEALAASDALLSLALLTPIDPARLTNSSLVRLQAGSANGDSDA